MLKITRAARGHCKPGKDTVLIAGGLIEIRIDKIRANQVHLSISAPRDIDIVRAELVHATPSAPTVDAHATPSA